jgi:hypothetical protein
MRGGGHDLKMEKDPGTTFMFSGSHTQDSRRKRHVADVIGLMRLFRCKPLPALSGFSMTPVPYSVASIRSRVVSTPGHGRQTPQSCVPAGRAATFVHSLLGFSQQSCHQGPFGLRSSRVSISRSKRPYGLTCSQISGVTARRSVGVNRPAQCGRASTCCIIKVLI